MYSLLQSFTLNINPTWTITSRHLEQLWYKPSQSLKLKKERKLHGNISSKSSYRSGFDLSTTNYTWYISSDSLWDYFNPSINFCTRHTNLGIFWTNFSNNYVRTRIKISKCVKPVLRSQYSCIKVSINSYFDPLITICTWCMNLANWCGFLTKFGVNNIKTRK